MLAFDAKRSKLAFTLVEFDENFKATQRVRHYVDADDLKLVCHDLLAGTFTQFEDQKGSAHDDYTEARVLSFKKRRSTGSPTSCASTTVRARSTARAKSRWSRPPTA